MRREQPQQQPQQPGLTGVRVSFCVTVRLSPGGRHVAAWRTRHRTAAQTATPALMVGTRAAERRNGPVRSRPPQLRQGGGW